MSTLTHKSSICGPSSFERNIKEYLKEHENITIDEKIIWTIKQIYKRKDKITGKKETKDKITSTFSTFIFSREHQDRETHKENERNKKTKKTKSSIENTKVPAHVISNNVILPVFENLDHGKKEMKIER